MKYEIGDILILGSAKITGVVLEVDDENMPILYRVFLQSTLSPTWVSQTHVVDLIYRPQSNSDTE
jgi:hypothetical protein